MLGAWARQDPGIFLLCHELPSTWLVYNFHGFRIEAVWSSGTYRSLSDSEALEELGLGVGREARRGQGFSGQAFALLWLALSLPLPMPLSLCFVLSGPRLHPRQKESRKPMKW